MRRHNVSTPPATPSPPRAWADRRRSNLPWRLLPFALAVGISAVLGPAPALGQSCTFVGPCNDFAGYNPQMCRIAEKCNLPRGNAANPGYCGDSFCTFYNCRVVNNVRVGPIVSDPVILAEVQVDGKFTAKVVLDVISPWNGESSNSSSPQYHPSGTLDVRWYGTATAGTGVVSFCEFIQPTSDHLLASVARLDLTCAGAPYDFGMISFRAEHCGGPALSCGAKTDKNGIHFLVPKSLLPGCTPPPDDCSTSTSSCQDCRPIKPCAVAVEGLGLSCTFSQSGAHLHYRGGGAGGIGFPGMAAWRTALGLYFSHDYAQRIVIDNATEGIDHVWAITTGASFREFKNPAPSSGLRLYDVTLTAPSDEYRRLYFDTTTDN